MEVWTIVNIGTYGPSWRAQNKDDRPPHRDRDAGSATPELALAYARETARQMRMQIESEDGLTLYVVPQPSDS